MDRLIPERVLVNRNEEERQKIANQYYQSYKKSQTTAYLLLLFLGYLGAHRFYLKNWILGLVILVFWTFISIKAMIEFFKFKPNSPIDLSLEVTALYLEVFPPIFVFGQILGLLFIIIEAIFLFSNVLKYNSGLFEKIQNEVGFDL